MFLNRVFSKMDCFSKVNYRTCVWRVLFERNNIKPCFTVSFVIVAKYQLLWISLKLNILASFNSSATVFIIVSLSPLCVVEVIVSSLFQINIDKYLSKFCVGNFLFESQVSKNLIKYIQINVHIYNTKRTKKLFSIKYPKVIFLQI